MTMISLSIKSINFIPSKDGLIDIKKNKEISDISSYTHKLSNPKLLDNSRLEKLQDFADNDVKTIYKEFNPVIYVWCRDTTSPVQKINVHDNVQHGFSLKFRPDFIPSENRNPILFYLVTKYTEDCQGVTGISGQSWIDWSSVFATTDDISIPVYKVLTDNKLRFRGTIVLERPTYTGTKKIKSIDSIDDKKILKDGWSTETLIFQDGGLSPYDQNHRVTHSIIYVTGGRLITAAPYYVHLQPRDISVQLLSDLLQLGCNMMKLDSKNIDRSKLTLYAVAFAQGISLLAKLCYYRTDIARYIDKRSMAGCTTDDDLWCDIGLTGSGDCEDLARFIFSLFCALLDCTNHDKSELIDFAKEIFNMYIPFMMHGGVTVGSANKVSDDDGYTSHMFVILLPKKRFLQSLYYGCKNGVEQESNEKLRNHASIVDLSKIDSNFNDDGQKLPALILEGTGFLDPTVIPIGLACHLDSSSSDIEKYDTIYDRENKFMAKNNYIQLGGIGFQCRPSMSMDELLKQKRCSKFYKSVVSGVTHYRFVRDYAVDDRELTSFTFHDLGRTYGIPMTQFLLYYSSVTDDVPQLVVPKSDCFRPSSHLFTVPSSIRTRQKFGKILELVKSWVIPPSSISSMSGLYDTIETIDNIPVIHDIDELPLKGKNMMVIRYNPVIISLLENFKNVYIHPLSKFNISNIEITIVLIIY